jgi:hypothetical protein
LKVALELTTYGQFASFFSAAFSNVSGVFSSQRKRSTCITDVKGKVKESLAWDVQGANARKEK